MQILFYQPINEYFSCTCHSLTPLNIQYAHALLVKIISFWNAHLNYIGCSPHVEHVQFRELENCEISFRHKLIPDLLMIIQ